MWNNKSHENPNCCRFEPKVNICTAKFVNPWMSPVHFCYCYINANIFVRVYEKCTKMKTTWNIHTMPLRSCLCLDMDNENNFCSNLSTGFQITLFTHALHALNNTFLPGVFHSHCIITDETFKYKGNVWLWNNNNTTTTRYNLQLLFLRNNTQFFLWTSCSTGLCFENALDDFFNCFVNFTPGANKTNTLFFSKHAMNNSKW